MLVLIVVLGWQLAHWTWVFLTPRPANPVLSAAPTDAEVAAHTISMAHLFGRATPAIGAVNSDSAAPNIHLRGVFAAIGQFPSYAIVNNGAKTDQILRIGDEIQPGMTLKSVYPQYIVVIHEGVAKRVNLEQKNLEPALPLGISPLGYNAYSISRNDLSAALRADDSGIKLGKLSTAAGGGLLVTEASSGSLAEKLGLQAGDVLRQINGQSISAPADLSRLYQQFKQASQIQLELMRSGKSLQLRYTVQQ